MWVLESLHGVARDPLGLSTGIQACDSRLPSVVILGCPCVDFDIRSSWVFLLQFDVISRLELVRD